MALIVAALAHPALALWLGAEFATRSTRVLQVLAYGVLANGLAAIPFAYIQGAGRARLTATLHVIELPLYLVALVWLTASLGIFGTALVWTIRVTADMAVLYFLAWRLDGVSGAALLRYAVSWAVASALFAGVLLFPMDIAGDHWGVALSAGALVAAAVAAIRMLKAARPVLSHA